MISLFDAIDYGVCIATDDGCIRFANRFFLNLLGYSLRELEGKHLEDITFDEDRDQNTELTLAFQRGSIDSYYLEKRYVRKSGEPVWIKLKVSRLSNMLPNEKGMFTEVAEITNLKEAEEAGNSLLKSYKDLFDASNDLAFILSHNGEIIDLNKAALIYFNANPSEIIGTSIIQYVTPDKSSLDLVNESFKKAWAGEPQRFEWWTSVDSRDTPQEVVLSKAAYLGEHVLIASVRDISERIVSEKKLHEQEALLRLVTENSTDVVCLFDADQKLRYISPVIEKMIGYSPSELEEIGFHELIHPEDQKIVASEIHDSIATQRSQSRYKYRQRRKDGTYFWLEVNAWRRYDHSGQIVQTIANLREVNDQVEAENKIKESERFLAETQRLAQIGSWEYDLESQSFKFSHEYLRLFQLSESTLSGVEQLLEYVVPEDKPVLEKKLNELISEGSGFNVDFTIKLPSGKIRSLNGIGYAERDAEGSISRVRGAIIDITRRKNNERTLRKLKDRAERAAEVKQQFLSNMSHELRTPLNAVLGMTNLLRSENPRPDQLEKINLLQYSAENLLHIINDILDFSALEEKQLQLKPEEFELEELLNNVIHLFTDRAREKGIQLKLDMENTPLRIRIDKFRLNQILFNLIGNAIKFTDEGEVIVRVEGKKAHNAHALLCFSISDTGVGIEESEYEHIFERFHQSKTASSFKYNGMGLGLSITKGLLELMDSRIRFDSKLGQGTTFNFDLEVEVPEASLVSDSSEGYGKGTEALRNLRVLVAEDNTINQFVLKKILARWQIQPEIVENGKEVVDLVVDQQRAFDIILLDLQMPVMDGVEAARILRKHNVETPIIAITAAVLPDQREHVLKSGMNDFIGKPFKPEELRQMLLAYLSPTTRAED